MSTYNPLVPTGLINLDTDYKNLQNNFQQADTSFGTDHYAFSDQTANNAFHKKSTYVSNVYTLVAPPPSIAGQVVVYSFNTGIGGNALAYVRDGVGTGVQLTNTQAPVAAQNGYSWIAGGILVQWGIANVNAGGASTTISFATANIAFPNNCFNVQITGNNNDPTNSPSANVVLIKQQTINAASFTVVNSSNSGTLNKIYWVAIGN